MESYIFDEEEELSEEELAEIEAREKYEGQVTEMLDDTELDEQAAE